MASRSSTSLAGDARRTRRARSRRNGLPPLSQKQVQAYLIARDVVRRIKRTCSLVPSLDRLPDLGDRMRSTHHPDPGTP